MNTSITAKNNVPIKYTWRLCLATTFAALGAIFWGYDIGILSMIYVAPGFKKSLHNPSSSETGLITAIYYAGSWVGYVFLAGPINEKLGRRWSGFFGVAVLCVGAALQAGAVHLAMMIIGRIIAGVGTSIVATAVPLYLSEIAPAKRRGAFVALNQIGIVFGISMSFWVGYGFSYWKTGRGVNLEWRLSVAMQFVPALLFCGMTPFLPESPRWLMTKDMTEAAAKSLALLRGTTDVQIIQAELEEIQANIIWHKQNSVTTARVFFQQRALWSRLWRAWALQFLQQMSGAAGIRYYLPSNFEAAGASKTLSLLASGLDGTVQVLCTVVGLFLIDRIGRRHALGIGSSIMAFSLMINGALQTKYPKQQNSAANNCNIFFIFCFTLGYSIGFGPVGWIYAAEIFPANVRAKGLAIAASGASIGSIIVGQVWPVAVQHIHARTFFIFMSFNVFSVFLVYLKYPETRGLSLEQIDSHFGHSNVHTDTEATPKQILGGHEEHVEIAEGVAKSGK